MMILDSYTYNTCYNKVSFEVKCWLQLQIN